MSAGSYRPGRPLVFDASNGIRAALEIVGADADRRVPVGDSQFAGSGDLRDSQVIRVDGNRGAIGYTDPAAVAAHERLDVRPGGGRERKYLESAVNENRRAALEAIADDLRRQIGA